MQDSLPNTHIGLFVVVEAQVALSENIGDIFNPIMGQRNKDPLPNFRGAFVSLASKEQPTQRIRH